jgi:CO/xanthine dehydrogenase Mo-binding subunit
MVLYNRCPNSRFEGFCVYTHLPSSGGTRGFGRPELLFALESTLDDLSYELGIDPVELRLKNTVRAGENLGDGFTVSSVALDKCLEEAADRIDWTRRNASPGQGQPAALKRGLGMAVAIHSGGNTFTDTESQLDLTPEGRILLSTGIPDIGTEQETTQRLMASRALGVSTTFIDSRWADTDTCPHDFGIFSSSSTTSKGAATIEASRNFRRQLLGLAGDLWGRPAEGLQVRDGGVQECDGADARWVSFATLGREADRRGQPIRATGRPQFPPRVGLFSFATSFVEVEVDTRTGVVRILRQITALDVGRGINPPLLLGQTRAATIQGLSYAMFEGLRFDSVERGVPLNGGFLDYKLPTVLDCPDIECFIVDSHEPLHPFGAKGAGELAMNPIAPAIANAIYNATGSRVRATPMLPSAVLDAASL